MRGRYRALLCGCFANKPSKIGLFLEIKINIIISSSLSFVTCLGCQNMICTEHIYLFCTEHILITKVDYGVAQHTDWMSDTHAHTHAHTHTYTHTHTHICIRIQAPRRYTWLKEHHRTHSEAINRLLDHIQPFHYEAVFNTHVDDFYDSQRFALQFYHLTKVQKTKKNCVCTYVHDLLLIYTSNNSISRNGSPSTCATWRRCVWIYVCMHKCT